MNKKTILERFGGGEAIIFAQGFDNAIIGIDCNGIVAYDISKMVNILVVRDKMTEEEALEYLEFNTFGSYIGENTPIYIWT